LCGKTPRDSFDSKCNKRFTPLHLACKFKASIEVIRLIVGRTPQETFNSQDNDGHGPYYLAWKYNTKEVQQLIRRSKNRLHRKSLDAFILTQIIDELEEGEFVEETMTDGHVTRIDLHQMEHLPIAEIMELPNLIDLKI